MCDATNFRVGRMVGLRCALRLPPRRALRFSIPIAAIERDENWQFHDFTLFLLRLFYDPPNFLKKRDAPNRVVTTSRKGFQNSRRYEFFIAQRQTGTANFVSSMFSSNFVHSTKTQNPAPIIADGFFHTGAHGDVKIHRAMTSRSSFRSFASTRCSET